jgi:amphiphysin
MEMTTLWSSIYSSIPSEHTNGRSYYETPESTLKSIDSYTAVLDEVKGTLLPILNDLDGKVVQPSMDMKKALEAISKMVKKRHHKKMDYDRFTGSVCPTETELIVGGKVEEQEG